MMHRRTSPIIPRLVYAAGEASTGTGVHRAGYDSTGEGSKDRVMTIESRAMTIVHAGPPQTGIVFFPPPLRIEARRPALAAGLWRATAIAGLVLLAAFLPEPAAAQTAAEKAAIAEAVGGREAEVLLSVHGAIGQLADAWAGGHFAAAEAADLAGSYRESAEGALSLVRQSQSTHPQATRIIAGAEALVVQSLALADWIKAGDRAPSQTYLALREKTDALLLRQDLAVVEPAPAGETQEVVLEIVRSVTPNGGAGDLGTMSVVHSSDALPERITWTYKDGSSDQGLGVPLPGTGMLAASFGRGVKSIHIYKLPLAGPSDRRIEGRWVTARAEAKIRPIRMVAASGGILPTTFQITGGGLFSMRQRAIGMALPVKWQFAQGEISGIGVMFGGYLAAIATEPGEKNGVALYRMDPDGTKAASWWVVSGANGAGSEQLVVKQLPGGSVLPDKVAAGDIEADVREIAESLRDDLGNAVKWKPTTSQINRISATKADADKLRAYVDEVYASLDAGSPAAKGGQTEIVLSGPDLRDLPGGYRKAMKHFRPGTSFYGFKYVRPGEDGGMRYDGLIRLDDAWIFIPKAWRAFRG
jgi:hypothetical protein